MKIERLIGIITILQQKGKVTAPYLAERFEVSRRTISRDIEEICRAGIPIVTTQGVDGGIELMEGYALDTTVFTKEELKSIFIGLQSLDSVSDTLRYAQLAEKIGLDIKSVSIADDMKIDLASFYKDSISEKIALIRKAIAERKCVKFQYYYPKGEVVKYVEPYLVVFQWSAWYLFGYCKERQDFRMYKFSRLWELCDTKEDYAVREIPKEKLEFGSYMADDKMITAIYDKSVKYRLVEEYGPNCFKEQEDGSLYTEWGFSSYEGALQWFLSFGNQVTVLGPEDFLQRYKEEISLLYKKIFCSF